MNTCPRCHNNLVREGGGASCLACGFTTETEELSAYVKNLEHAELMATAPTRVVPREPKRDFQEKKAYDLWLGEQAATRHGVSLEDLQKPLRGWRNTPPKVHIAFHAVICDLASAKLSTSRIARVLCRRNRTILDSPGLARGRR